MTEFRVEVVRIGAIRKHENADSLSITDVLGGYPCIIKTGDFTEGDLAVYVPVDALVPVESPAFQFLAKEANADGFARIKARRLRGVFSMGLLVKAHPGAQEGDICHELLGIKKYLPPAEKEPVERAPKPKWPWWRWALAKVLPWWFAPKKKAPGPKVPYYDIEGFRRYKHLFKPGEQVVVTEKIHGAQFRAVWTGGKLHVGSRTVWGRVPESDWGIVAEKYGLADKLKEHQDMVLFGEVYGNVQDLKYGKPNSVDLVMFDLLDMRSGEFFCWDDLCVKAKSLGVPTVPLLYVGPWSEELTAMCEGKTTMPGANHVREGIVIKPAIERKDPHFGRVILKLAGEGYLTRKEGK